MSDQAFAHGPSTLRLGDLEVRRLGYGAMRLPGPEVWGEPKDPAQARAVLQRAVALGVNLIDTAWYYGPFVANRLIAEALHPYPKDLVLATKLGGARRDDKSWYSFIRPEQLREGAQHDLRTLKRDHLDVVHLRYMKSEVSFAESLDALIAMKSEGLLRHIALSNVGVKELEQALAKTEIVAVQNFFNIGGGGGPIAKMTHAEVDDPEGVLDFCTARGIAYLPFFPLAMGNVGQAHPGLAEVAKRHGASVAQIGIAWLLARSKVMLPIPGTSSLAHLEENWAAREIALSPDDMATLTKK
ncbi:MAG: aldo/keto reductase [Polyangiales bacterium]